MIIHWHIINNYLPIKGVFLTRGEDPLLFRRIRIHGFRQRRIRIQGKFEHLNNLEENRATFCFYSLINQWKNYYCSEKVWKYIFNLKKNGKKYQGFDLFDRLCKYPHIYLPKKYPGSGSTKNADPDPQPCF